MLESDFAIRLRLVRVERELNQKQLGELLGLSSSAISDYENSVREPTTKQVRTFAETLGVPFEWLCGLGPTFAERGK